MPLLVVGMLKGIYVMASTAPTEMERSVLAVFARIVSSLYHGLAGVAPGLAEALWRVAPAPDLRSLGLTNSAGFLSIYFLLLLGGYLCGQANRLDARISRTMQRVEEMAWEEALRDQLRGDATPHQVAERLDIVISLAGQEPPWYQRPLGLVLFGIALPLLVEVLKVVVGLAKLP